MRKIIIICLTLSFVLIGVGPSTDTQPQTAEGAFRALAGQWNLEFEYCTYGVRLTVTAGLFTGTQVDPTTGDVTGVPNPFTVLFQTQVRPSSAAGAIVSSGQVDASFPDPIPTPITEASYFFSTTGYFPWTTGTMPASTNVVSQFTVPSTGFEAWPTDADSSLNDSTPPDYDDDVVNDDASCSFTYEDVYPPSTSDGRLNPDAGATAVVYCELGDIVIYGINLDSNGTKDIVITASEASSIEANNAIGIIDEHITELGRIYVEYLGSGYYQVVGPDSALDPSKRYDFSWRGC